MTLTHTTVPTVSDVEAPQPGIYELDTSHSQVGFVARHMMVSKVRGQIRDFSGTVRIAEDPLDSSVEVELAVTSIDTGDEDRDGHLRSADFFDAGEHPTIRFVSTRIEPTGDGGFAVHGDLTIRGISKPVVLDATYEGSSTANDSTVLGFSATTKVNREDWGLTWNQALETGGVLVSKEITLQIDAEASRQS